MNGRALFAKSSFEFRHWKIDIFYSSESWMIFGDSFNLLKVIELVGGGQESTAADERSMN